MILLVAAAVVGGLVGVLAQRLVVAESSWSVSRALTGLVSALLWTAAAWRFGWAWDLPAYLYLASVSVPLALIDLRVHRLPNSLTLSAYPATATLLALPAAAGGDWPGYGRAMAAAAALLAFYAVLHVINPAGMGLGDVKLSAPLGALLGWLSWATLLRGALAGFLLAAVIGVALMLAKRAGRKSALPFGPFMLAGAWLAILLP